MDWSPPLSLLTSPREGAPSAPGNQRQRRFPTTKVAAPQERSGPLISCAQSCQRVQLCSLGPTSSERPSPLGLGAKRERGSCCKENAFQLKLPFLSEGSRVGKRQIPEPDGLSSRLSSTRYCGTPGKLLSLSLPVSSSL